MNLVFRELKESDFYKNYFELLGQLTDVEEEKITFFKLRLKKKEESKIYFLYNNKIHHIEQHSFGYKSDDVEVIPMDKNGKYISDVDESINTRNKVFNSMFGSNLEVS